MNPPDAVTRLSLLDAILAGHRPSGDHYHCLCGRVASCCEITVLAYQHGLRVDHDGRLVHRPARTAWSVPEPRRDGDHTLW